MSVSDALHDWQQLAASAVELNVLQKKVGDLQAAHDNARVQFETELDQLQDEEREAILSIMAIYDQCSQGGISLAGAPGGSSAKSSALNWLVNKVGNEGVEGINWGDVLTAWNSQFPETPSSTLYTVLYQHKELFTKSGLGKRAMLKLTTEGQAMFRDAN